MKIKGTSHEDSFTFMVISRSVLIRMRNVSDRFMEKIKTRILCFILFFKNRAVYEIMWKNMLQPDRPQVKIWRLRFACWMFKATDTLSAYIIINDFPRQQQQCLTNAPQCYVIRTLSVYV